MAVLHEVLVAYDVENNKRRKALFEALKDVGLVPVQKSVFWGHITLAEEKYVVRLFSDLEKGADKAFLVRLNLSQAMAERSFGYRLSDFGQPTTFNVL